MLGLGAGLAIAMVAAAVESSRLAFGPYAFYGNGALIVPAIGAGLALYGIWTWLLRRQRPSLDLLWSTLGLHLGLGAGLAAAGGVSLAGILLSGLLFVIPAAIAAFGALRLLESRSVRSAVADRGPLLLTAVVIVGMVLTFVPFPPLGVGLITGAFITVARTAPAVPAIGLGVLLFIVLLAAALALPLLFLR